MILSIDDGCASDVRVAELARKYNIDCTFYWPVEWHGLAYSKGYEPLSLADAEDIAKEFPVGSHGITHRYLTQIDPEQAKTEIRDSKYMLEDLFDTEVSNFCFPRGYSNPELNEYSLQFYEDYRLTKGTDSQGNRLVHVHPDSGANNNIPWADCIGVLGDVHLWCHSWELDKHNLWNELEEVLKSV